MRGNCYQKYVNNICFCQNIWCITFVFKDITFCTQTQLFKYKVNSTMLFSKSLWTHIIRQTFFGKYDVAHGVIRVPAPSLNFRFPSRKNICRSLLKFRNYLDILFNPLSFTSYPKRLELHVPLNWGIGDWSPLWCEMHIFQRYRHRQPNTTTKLVKFRPCHKNMSQKR